MFRKRGNSKFLFLKLKCKKWIPFVSTLSLLCMEWDTSVLVKKWYFFLSIFCAQPQKLATCKFQTLISLHIRSMWETICDAQAGLCTVTTNSKICVHILQRAPLWNFRSESPPPPKKTWNLGRSWHFEYFQFWLQSTPPPENWNLGRSW